MNYAIVYYQSNSLFLKPIENLKIIANQSIAKKTIIIIEKMMNGLMEYTGKLQFEGDACPSGPVLITLFVVFIHLAISVTYEASTFLLNFDIFKYQIIFSLYFIPLHLLSLKSTKDRLYLCLVPVKLQIGHTSL